jgi:glucose/mannose transport system substrate-binding protein
VDVGRRGTALESLFHVYKYKYPGVEVVNAAVTGGGKSEVNHQAANKFRATSPPTTHRKNGRDWSCLCRRI